MGSTSALFALLLLLMGAVAGLLLAILVMERLPRRGALVVGATWFVLVFVPLQWLTSESGPAWVPWGGARDYAAAAPMLLSLAVALFVLARATRGREPAPAAYWRPGLGLRHGLGLVAIAAGWTAWLVSAEGTLNRFTPLIIGNTMLMLAGAVVGCLCAIAVRFRRDGAIALTGGVLAALAAATAASAYLGPGAAVVLGLTVGAVAARTLVRRNADDRSLGRVVAVGLMTGAPLGLLTLGLLDQTVGFFFTGQPGVAIAQAVLVAAVAAYSMVVIGALLGALRLAPAEWKLWAIPDSNR